MNEVLYDKLIINPTMTEMPINKQAELIKCFSDVLEQVKEERPDATISELLSTDI